MPILFSTHIWLLHMLIMHSVFLACPGFPFWVPSLRNLSRGLMLNGLLKGWTILTLGSRRKNLERCKISVASFRNRPVAMKFFTILLSIKNFNVLTLQSAPASRNYFECLNYPSSIRSNNPCVKMVAFYFVQNTSSTQRHILGIEVNLCMSQS